VSEASRKVYPEKKVRELDKEEREAIRARLEEGQVDVYQLATEFGCSPSQVAGIKAGLSQ
jgi:hypothetical protein